MAIIQSGDHSAARSGPGSRTGWLEQRRPDCVGRPRVVLFGPGLFRLRRRQAAGAQTGGLGAPSGSRLIDLAVAAAAARMRAPADREPSKLPPGRSSSSCFTFNCRLSSFALGQKMISHHVFGAGAEYLLQSKWRRPKL